MAAVLALLLAPYLFLGRSMVPLDLLPRMEPWASERATLFGTPPPVHNPLLDSLQQYYPRRVRVRESAAAGRIPLWESRVYGGSPFLAAQQGSVLYPPSWLLALLPPERQFGWSAFLHLLLAAAGTWLFLRRMGLGTPASLTGALAFSCNGFLVVWLAYPNVTQWTLCWLPLALWSWEASECGARPLPLAASGAALAAAVLGGHGQSTAYLLLVWLSWVALRLVTARTPPLRALAVGLGPLALAFLLGLGHMLPVLDYLPRTDRGERIPWEAVSTNGMPASQLWTFLVPRLFGDETARFGTLDTWLPQNPAAKLAFVERSFYPGITVLALTLPGLLWLRRPRSAGATAELPTARMLTGYSVALAAVGVLLAMGTPLYWPLWRFVPGFGQFTAVARVICVCAWAFACLAALGAERLLRSGPDGARALRVLGWSACVLAALAGTAGYLFPLPLPLEQALDASGQAGVGGKLVLEAAVACGLALATLGAALLALRFGEARRPAAGLSLPAIIAADLLWFGFGFNPATDPALLKPVPTALRALQAEQAARPNQRFLSVGPPGRELDFRFRMPSNLPATFGLPDLSGSDSFVSRRYLEWAAATRAAGGRDSPWARVPSPNLRSAAVGLYLLPGRENPPGLVRVAGNVWRDPEALPAARVHGHVQALSSPQAVLENLSQPAREPRVALTTGPGARSTEGPARVAPAAGIRQGPNSLSVETDSPFPGLLVVSESYEPGWRAWVDGMPVPIQPADHLWLGVPVEAGRRRVELRYEPASWRVGAFGTLLGLAVLAASLTALARRRSGPGP